MSFPVLGFEMGVEECVGAVEELVGEMVKGACSEADASCTASVQGVLEVVVHGLGVFASTEEGVEVWVCWWDGSKCSGSESSGREFGVGGVVSDANGGVSLLRCRGFAR